MTSKIKPLLLSSFQEALLSVRSVFFTLLIQSLRGLVTKAVLTYTFIGKKNQPQKLNLGFPNPPRN